MDRRLYLLAYLDPEVNLYLDRHAGPAAACRTRRPVPAARRHLTILNLAIEDMPEALLVAAVRLAVTAVMPCAFRMVLDSCIVRTDRALIAASEPVLGFRRLQRSMIAALRRYTIDLPRAAAPSPHVTLGYDCDAAGAVRTIDGVSWLVDTLSLIVSRHGEGIHETVERWSLPPPRSAA